MPPPTVAELLEKVQRLSVRVPPFETPPPLLWLPLVIVRAVSTQALPPLTLKTRLLLLPEIVSPPGRAEASTVRLGFGSNSPLVNVIVWPERLASNVMVEPAVAWTSA